MAETIVPIMIAFQLYPVNSCKSILINGYNIEAPNIIGMLNKNEYLAAVNLSFLFSNPVAIVKPERENPGKAAKPCATAINIDVFKSILFDFSCILFENASAENNKIPVNIRSKPTIAGEYTKFSATSCNGKAITTVIIVPIKMYNAIFALLSEKSFDLTANRKAFKISIISFLKYINTAINVPK